MTTFDDLLLRLNRPEYVASPEALLSSLAWRGHTPLRVDGKPVALVFEREGSSSAGKNIVTRESRPSFLEALEQEARANGNLESGERIPFAMAVANSLVGVVSAKSRTRAAVPIGPAVGRLQNLPGLLGKANPPRFDEIIEEIYSLGGGQARSCAGQWVAASDRRRQSDSLVRMVEAAALGTVVTEPVPPSGGAQEEVRGVQGLGGGPFRWMASNWDLLCSDQWVDALPMRVWTDWATTILRVGVGFAYIWEAHWYLAVGRMLLDDPHGQELMPTVPSELIKWAVAAGDDGQRNVASEMKSAIERGSAVRAILHRIGEAQGDQPLSTVHAWLHEISQAEVRESLQNALRERQGGSSANNVWEAVKYSLVYREVNGPNADHYGLLRSVNNRSLYLDPGTEFLAMVASLAIREPGGEGDVGQVLDSLSQLGLKPRLNEVVERLELAGLAHGSADADQGVAVSRLFTNEGVARV